MKKSAFRISAFAMALANIFMLSAIICFTWVSTTATAYMRENFTHVDVGMLYTIISGLNFGRLLVAILAIYGGICLHYKLCRQIGSGFDVDGVMLIKFWHLTVAITAGIVAIIGLGVLVAYLTGNSQIVLAELLRVFFTSPSLYIGMVIPMALLAYICSKTAKNSQTTNSADTTPANAALANETPAEGTPANATPTGTTSSIFRHSIGFHRSSASK